MTDLPVFFNRVESDPETLMDYLINNLDQLVDPGVGASMPLDADVVDVDIEPRNLLACVDDDEIITLYDDSGIVCLVLRSIIALNFEPHKECIYLQALKFRNFWHWIQEFACMHTCGPAGTPGRRVEISKFPFKGAVKFQ